MSRDNQWLIRANTGKTGTDSLNNNIYNPGNSISNNFTIRGVKHPSFVYNNDAKKWIFVIYSDGEHFNSREELPAPTYFTSAFILNPASVSNHNFESLHLINNPGHIDYLYLTNIYEGDDPPPGVMAIDQKVNGFGPSYQFVKTIPKKIITATHMISPMYDYTLIISHELIREQQLKDTIFTLSYNIIKDTHTSVNNIINSSFFSLSPFYNELPAGILSKGNCKILSQDSIELDISNGNFTYINFALLNSLNQYFPDLNSYQFINDSDYWRYAALFTIKGNKTGNIFILEEPIRLEHPSKSSV